MRPVYENQQFQEDVVHIRLFQNHFSNNREHWHEKIEILYCKSGHTLTRCNGIDYRMDAGDIMMINANEFHIATLSHTQNEYYCIQINPNFLNNFIENHYVTFINYISDTECSRLLDYIIEQYEKTDIQNTLELRKNLYSFFCILSKRYVKSVLSETDFKKHLKKQHKLEAIISYINNSYGDFDMSVDKLSTVFSLSSSYLAHFFKNEYGKNISEYITETRIRNAKMLLGTTDLPVGEVAYKCGFIDANYFSRKFRQLVGNSPRKYRGEISNR